MPSVRCIVCAKFVSPVEAAKCSRCKESFHRSCVSLPPKGQITGSWKCPNCKKTPRKGNVGNYTEDNSSEEFVDSSPLNITASEDEKSSISALTSELNKFKHDLCAEFRTLREEFRTVSLDISQIKDTLKACNERMDGIESRVSALENAAKTHTGSPDIEREIVDLKRELNERDQELLSNDLEIANLPEVNGENVLHTIHMVATKLGVQLENRDIVSADRVGGRHIRSKDATGAAEVRPRRIIVRLARRELRDELLHSARVRRGATSADLGMSGPQRRFYLSERLTTANRQLFRRARDAAQRLSWQFVWTRRGRILVRQKHGDPVRLIRTEEDLHNVFASDEKNK